MSASHSAAQNRGEASNRVDWRGARGAPGEDLRELPKDGDGGGTGQSHGKRSLSQPRESQEEHLLAPTSGDTAYGPEIPNQVVKVSPEARAMIWGVLRQQWGRLLIGGVLATVGALLGVAQPLLVNQLIDSIGKAPIAPMVWMLAGLVVADAVVAAVQHYVVSVAAESAVLDIRKRLVHRILRWPIAAHDAHRGGDLVTRVTAETKNVEGAINSGVVEIVGSVVMLVAAITAMATIDMRLLLIVGATCLVVCVIVVVTSAALERYALQSQRALGQLGAGMSRALPAIRTIRAARAEPLVAAELEIAADKAWDNGIRIARLTAMLQPASGLAIQGMFLVVLGIGGAQVAAGTMDVGDLVAFEMLMFMLAVPVMTIFNAVVSVRTATGGIQRIHEALVVGEETDGDEAGTSGTKPAVGHREEASEGHEVTGAATGGGRVDVGQQSTAEASAVPNESGGIAKRSSGEQVSAEASSDVNVTDSGNVETSSTTGQKMNGGGVSVVFENVSFGYDNGHQVLRGVSFVVPAGTMTAFVGSSGSGKSTVLALLERFYDVGDGTITVDGQDLGTVSRDASRSVMAYVEQDCPVLAGTVRDNLLLAAPDADDVACRTVLDQVALTQRFDREAGLDTVLGDRGINLSGGERQRLAVARAILTDAPLLLLDEPTSSVDAQNEQRMHDAIAAAGTGRTTLVVAHRLATVKGADQLVVMDAGKVIACGRHEDLMMTCDTYRDFANRQLLT